MKKITILLALLCAAAFAQQRYYFTDSRDGRKYNAVQIGYQVWMAENLNYNASRSKCYDNSGTNCNKYGRLYEWETAMRACPNGWHLPSDDEWEILVDYAGTENYAGNRLKATKGWSMNGNGSNILGFSALPGGNASSNGKYGYSGVYGAWWTATKFGGSGRAYYRFIESESSEVGRDKGYFYDPITPIYSLFSVRCVQD